MRRLMLPATVVAVFAVTIIVILKVLQTCLGKG